MVDINEMRKKFPVKDGGRRHKKNAAIKRIAREYEMKKAELNGLKAPAMKKGVVYYVVVGLGLLLLASLIMSVTGKGGKAPISKAKLQVEKSLDALVIALGRYRYHTGEYPSTEEGLEALASKNVVKPGWNGPYIRQVVQDPWHNDYVYISNGASKPTLYSKGPDGRGGTDDDYVARQELFDEPFRDTSWTKEWVPYRLRGYVVAPDEETRKVVQAQVTNYLAATARSSYRAAKEHKAFLAKDVTEDELSLATGMIRDGREKGAVEITSAWTWPEEMEGKAVEVTANVQGDEAELFVNNVSRGKSRDFTWQTQYEPGEIKVIGFKDGHPIGEDAVRTALEPAMIKLTLLAKSLGDDEVGFAIAEVMDEWRTMVPDTVARPDVAFTLTGPGEIVRTQGCTVAFRRTRPSGEPLKLTASAAGVRLASVEIPWRASE